jgi:crotonobetaine/carnitine-CoA ligase
MSVSAAIDEMLGPPSYVLTREWSRMSLVALLEECARTRPDDVFFTHAKGSLTVSEFDRMSNKVANGLEAAGIGAGAHVAVVMDSSADYYAVWFALAKLRAVEVAVNPAYRGELLRHQLALSRATAVVVDGAYRDEVISVVEDLDAVHVVVARGGWAPAAPTARVELHRFEDLVLAATAAPLGAAPPPESVAGVVFTSGTTGPSKGVLLSHHYLVAYGLMYAEVNHLRAEDVLLNFQPVFHMTAKFVVIATLSVGGRMHLMERFSVSRFWDEVRRHGVTNMVAIGGVCAMLMSAPPKPTTEARRRGEQSAHLLRRADVARRTRCLRTAVRMHYHDGLRFQ